MMNIPMSKVFSAISIVFVVAIPLAEMNKPISNVLSAISIVFVIAMVMARCAEATDTSAKSDSTTKGEAQDRLVSPCLF